MCKDCEEISWEEIGCENKDCRVLSFLENDSLETWKIIVATHTDDQMASFLASLAELMANPKSESIHPVIGRFFKTYEKILTDPKKKFVFFEHFCSICFSH